MVQFIYRLARQEDLPLLADLRWRLKTDDADVADEAAYTAFVAQFVAFEGAERSPGEAFHWVADSAGHIVAAMSVIVVTKPPAPGGSVVAARRNSARC